MVARAGRGLVLAGASHRGKSTSVAACAIAGFDVLGDDAIALERDAAGGVVGHCVHGAIKLRAAGLERHPELAGRTTPCGPPWEGEHVAFASEVFGGQLVPSAGVAAIALPELVDVPRTDYTPIAAGRALRDLVGSMLSAEPGGLGAGFAALADLVALVPVYRLQLGTSTSGVAGVLDALLDELSV
jgi:hypothetical protein